MSIYDLDKEKDILELMELKKHSKSSMNYNFSLRLRECMIEYNLSQKDLSEIMGVSISNVSNYLNAKQEPKIEVIYNLVNDKRIKYSSDYFLGLTDLKRHKNISAYNQLGLKEESIDALKEFKKAKDLYNDCGIIFDEDSNKFIYTLYNYEDILDEEKEQKIRRFYLNSKRLDLINCLILYIRFKGESNDLVLNFERCVKHNKEYYNQQREYKNILQELKEKDISSYVNLKNSIEDIKKNSAIEKYNFLNECERFLEFIMEMNQDGKCSEKK